MDAVLLFPPCSPQGVILIFYSILFLSVIYLVGTGTWETCNIRGMGSMASDFAKESDLLEMGNGEACHRCKEGTVSVIFPGEYIYLVGRDRLVPYAGMKAMVGTLECIRLGYIWGEGFIDLFP